MDLFSIMNKSGQIQISIIHFLLENNLKSSKDELLKGLNLSNFILDSQIDILQTTLNQIDVGMELIHDYNTGVIYLKKQNNTNLDELHYFLLRDSVDYKLVVYLYNHPQFSISKLAAHLSLGEAAVYKRITKLNEQIQEFGIVIKRGKMHGSELQICFFFYKFFWNALPFDGIETIANDQNILNFVSYLEKQLNQKLGKNSKVRLYLWIRILKMRVSVQSTSNDEDQILESFVTHQLNDPLYSVIRESYFLSMSQFAVMGSDYKSIYLYLFISSIFIMDPKNTFLSEAGYWPTFNNKVIELNEMVVTNIKNTYNLSLDMIEPEFVTNWKYILTQIHSILYYFQGNVTFLNEDMLYSALLKTNIQFPNFQLVKDLIKKAENILGYNISGTTRHLITRIYSYFINEMRRFSHKKIKIGVCYNRDYLQTHFIVQNLKAEFENKMPITCEIALLDSDYDLFICDSEFFASDFSHSNLYIINDFLTPADSEALTTLLKHLLSREES